MGVCCGGMVEAGVGVAPNYPSCKRGGGREKGGMGEGERRGLIVV